jgi:glycosyltransferase involved in cell wall biosynthesis
VYILLMHAWGMGGTIRTTLNLAGHLARDREVEVLSIVRRRSKPFFELPPGVTVTAVDDQRKRGRDRPPGLLNRVLRHLPSLLLYPADRASRSCTMWTDLTLVRALWRARSGLLIGTRPALNLAALLARRPGTFVIGGEHMHYSQHSPTMRSRIRQRYPDLDALVVLTEHDRREYGEVLARPPLTVRIPNAVPIFARPVVVERRPVVLAAGRLVPQKGFDRLIDAFALIAPAHPDWILRICGRGPARDDLQRQIVARGLTERAILMGAVKSIEQQMAEASIFVLSSRFEGLPMAMLEAMSMGMPVVSFDCPTGPREVIEHGRDGILIPNGDVAGLAAAVAGLMHDPAARERLGAEATVKAARYSMDVVGPQWEKLLAALEDAPGQRSARPISQPGASRGVTAGVLDAPCPSGRTERTRNLA